MGLHVFLQLFILLLAWIVSAALLASFAYGFYSEMSLWLSAPFLGLVLGSLIIGGANVASFLLHPSGNESAGARPRLLLAAIPLAFAAASLDCTGLSLSGCTGFCTFIKLIWIPLLAVVCGAWVWRATRKKGREDGAFAIAVLIMSLVPIAPHCICFNPGNGLWIELLGASPVCYAWGLTVAVISVSAMLSGKRARESALVCYLIICGATAFFAAHHFLHFPW